MKKSNKKNIAYYRCYSNKCTIFPTKIEKNKYDENTNNDITERSKK